MQRLCLHAHPSLSWLATKPMRCKAMLSAYCLELQVMLHNLALLYGHEGMVAVEGTCCQPCKLPSRLG